MGTALLPQGELKTTVSRLPALPASSASPCSWAFLAWALEGGGQRRPATPACRVLQLGTWVLVCCSVCRGLGGQDQGALLLSRDTRKAQVKPQLGSQAQALPVRWDLDLLVIADHPVIHPVIRPPLHPSTICPPIHLSTHSPSHLSIRLSTHPTSIHPAVCLSICPSVHPSICLTIHSSTHLLVHLSIHPSSCPPVCPPFHPLHVLSVLSAGSTLIC